MRRPVALGTMSGMVVAREVGDRGVVHALG
jgi:hypothetical protein